MLETVSSHLKVFFVHTRTRRFQIPPKAFSKISGFVSVGLVWTVGLPLEIKQGWTVSKGVEFHSGGFLMTYDDVLALTQKKENLF